MTEEIKETMELKEEILEIKEELSENTVTVEDEARKQGWKPKEEFSGDPKDWRSAEIFLERGPLMKHINELNKRLEFLVDASEKAEARAKSAELAAYKKYQVELKQFRDAAIASGDTQQVDTITDEMFQANMRAQELERGVNTLSPELQTFKERNETIWFNHDSPKNEAITGWAINREAQLKYQNPGISEKELLMKVENDVKANFPEVFSKMEHTTSPTPIVGSSQTTSRQHAVEGPSDLDSDARKAYEMVAKIKKGRGEKYTVKQFLDTYRILEDRDHERRN